MLAKAPVQAHCKAFTFLSNPTIAMLAFAIGLILGYDHGIVLNRTLFN